MLYQLVVKLRAMQLFYHSCHNLCKGSLFIQDHDLFGSFYSALESDYDGVIERAIPVEGDEKYEIPSLLKDVYKLVGTFKVSAFKENKPLWEEALKQELELSSMITSMCKLPEMSEGTRQLIGEVANKSESRQYKISRRIK